MSRKKKHPEHVNHERWLVSYADFITLLFAFFVVMFATSQVDTNKMGRFTESFSKAVGIEVFPESGKSILGGNSAKDAATISGKGDMSLPVELQELKSELQAKAAKDKFAGVEVLSTRNELVLRLSDSVVFDSGNDEVKGPALEILKRIAGELKERKVTIRVEGHTDDKPIKTVRFRSNWDLSTARATAVVLAFAKDGIENDRLSAAGYAEFHPITSNETPEGRAQNRRVDIIVSAEPVAEKAKADGEGEEGSASVKEENTVTQSTDGGVSAENEAAPAKEEKTENEPKDAEKGAGTADAKKDGVTEAAAEKSDKAEAKPADKNAKSAKSDEHHHHHHHAAKGSATDKEAKNEIHVESEKEL
ncbi:MAG TPA: flagellar motor protein MotB [Polyangiaceae bacterium]